MFQDIPRKNLLLLIIAILFLSQFQLKLLASTLSESEQNNLADFEQSRVSLKLDFGAGCGLELYVNNILISPQKFGHGGPNSLYMPISHFLVPGKNTLSLNAFPTREFDFDYPEQATCSISLIVWDSKTMRPDSKDAVIIGPSVISVYDAYQLSSVEKVIEEGPLADKDINRIVKGDLNEYRGRGLYLSQVTLNHSLDNGQTLKRDFELDFPIYRSKWLDSPIIGGNNEAHASLFAEYQKLAVVLESGNLKKWMLLNEEKYSEMAKLTGVTPDLLWAESVALPAIITGEDKGWKLRELDISNTIFLRLGQGRIATLLAKSRSPILKYDSLVDDDYYVIIPIFFRLDESGNWIIVR